MALPAQLSRQLPTLDGIQYRRAPFETEYYIGDQLESCILTDKLGGESYLEFSFLDNGSAPLAYAAPGDVVTVSPTRSYTVAKVTHTWVDGYAMVEVYAERSWYSLLYAPWGRPPFLAGAPITHIDGLVRDTEWAPGEVVSAQPYGWAPKAEGSLGILAEVASTVGADLHFDPVNKRVNLGTFAGYPLPPATVGVDIESVERVQDNSGTIDCVVGYSADGLARYVYPSSYSDPSKAGSAKRWGHVELPEGVTSSGAHALLKAVLDSSRKHAVTYELSGYSMPALDVWPGDDLTVLNLDGAPLPNVATTRVVEVVRDLVEPHKSSAVLSSSRTELADLIPGESRTSAGIVSITQTSTMNNKSGIVELTGTGQVLTNNLMVTASPATLAGWQISQTSATAWSAYTLSTAAYSSLFSGTAVPAAVLTSSTSRAGAVATVRSQGDLVLETRRSFSNVRQVVAGQIGLSNSPALSTEEDAALFGAQGTLSRGVTAITGTPKPLVAVHGGLGVLSCGRLRYTGTTEQFTASVWRTVATLPPAVRPRYVTSGVGVVYSDALGSYFPVQAEIQPNGQIRVLSRLTLPRPTDIVLPRLVFRLHQAAEDQSGYAPVLEDPLSVKFAQLSTGARQDTFGTRAGARLPTAYRHGNQVTLALGEINRWDVSDWGAGKHIHVGTVARGLRPLETTPKALALLTTAEPSFAAWWVTKDGEIYMEVAHSSPNASYGLYCNPLTWVV